MEFLQQHFGKAGSYYSGSYYYWAARGIDERPVRADRIRREPPRQTRARTTQISAGKTTPCDVVCPLK